MSFEDSGDLLESASDQTLVDRAADGDTHAFRVIVTRHASLLRAFFARITEDPAEIDQLARASLESAWRELPHLSRADYLRSFLLLIADAEACAAFQTSRRPAA